MIEIDGIKIGQKNTPYVIAEISANHGGSIEQAKESIALAKKSGASAVKIQTYTPDTMTIKSKKDDFLIKEGLWKGYTLYDLYVKSFTPFDWHEELFRHAKKIGITLFSSPFDETAVALLENLNAPAYKISSFELVDLPLIKRTAECGKPLLISTGMANLNEISEAVDTAIKYGNGEILLFHCISSYPTPMKASNLKNIQFLKNEFSVEVGLSDHTLSNLAATLSIGLGASAIEKHFKPSDATTSSDSSFSINPDQLENLILDCNNAWSCLGNPGFHRSPLEETSRQHRRSLYFMKDLTKGSVVGSYDIRSIRPGNGVSPKFKDEIIGKTLCVDVERGDPVVFEAFLC